MQTVLFCVVAVADPALVLNAQDLAPGAGAVGYEGRGGLLGGGGEAGIVRGDVALGEPAVGRLDLPDAGPPELLGQEVLQCAEGTLGAAARDRKGRGEGQRGSGRVE